MKIQEKYFEYKKILKINNRNFTIYESQCGRMVEENPLVRASTSENKLAPHIEALRRKVETRCAVLAGAKSRVADSSITLLAANVRGYTRILIKRGANGGGFPSSFLFPHRTR